MKRHRSSGVLRLISVVVLCFFTWSFGGVFDIAHAVNNSQKSKVNSSQSKTGDDQQPKYQRPEEKFQKTVEAIEKILNDTSTDTDTKKNKLRGKRSEIEFYDTEIRKQFTATENKLKNEGLPPEILERHYSFVKKYDNNLNELKNNLDAIEKAKDKKEADEAIENTRKFFEKVKPPKKHVPLDPNNLPHRTAEPVFKEPRTTPEEFTEGKEQKAENIEQKQKPVLVASNGSLNGLLAQSSTLYAQSSNLPTAADLAETIEVKFTPAIRAKAAELSHNPVRIYNFVRNSIEFIPTYGSIQGADMCLQTKQCNDFDTASLLIALLRASGIHARYVYGTVEIPMEKVKNWVGGVTDPNTAATILATAGAPGKLLTEGGKIKYAQMEHMWVEAYVPYGPYSGRPSNLNSSKTWIPLDASFKQYTYTDGINLQAAVPFDAQGFVTQIKATATINEVEGYVTNVNSGYVQTTLSDYQTQVQNYINQNIPNASAEDIFGKKEIIKQDLGILPATLPYKTIVAGVKYSAMPDNLRHKVTFTLNDPYFFETSLSYTVSIPELAGKRVTLSYTPATTTDQQIIESYGGLYSVPCYLVNMKPQIRIEGTVKAMGSSIGLGNMQTFGMTFAGPNANTDVVSNNVTTGAYYGIGIGPHKIPKELIDQRRMKLESVKDTINQNNIYTDDYIGELLYTTAMAYFFELDVFETVFASSYKVVDTKQGSEGMVAKDLNVSCVFGIPMEANEGSMFIDVDRYIHSPFSKVADKTKAQQFMLALGQMSSAMEHGIFEQLYQAKGVSALKLIEVANTQGIPIYTVNQENISSILPKLLVASDIKSEIQNAVNAGKTVIVHKQAVSYYGWNGTGYIILNPNTGAGAYMISANLASGGVCVASGGCTIFDLMDPEELFMFLRTLSAIILIPGVIIGIAFLGGVLADVIIGIGIASAVIVVSTIISVFVIYLLYLLIISFLASNDKDLSKYAFKRRLVWII